MAYSSDSDRFMCKPPTKWKSTADDVCTFYDMDVHCMGSGKQLMNLPSRPIESAEACYEVRSPSAGGSTGGREYGRVFGRVREGSGGCTGSMPLHSVLMLSMASIPAPHIRSHPCTRLSHPFRRYLPAVPRRVLLSTVLT